MNISLYVKFGPLCTYLKGESHIFYHVSKGSRPTLSTPPPSLRTTGTREEKDLESKSGRIATIGSNEETVEPIKVRAGRRP